MLKSVSGQVQPAVGVNQFFSRFTLEILSFVMHQAIYRRPVTNFMGPNECATAMVSTMSFMDNGGLSTNIADYGCYTTDYWATPYTGGLSPMKQIEGNA